MSRFIDLVELLETRLSNNSAEEVAAYFRILSFKDKPLKEELFMRQVCGQSKTLILPWPLSKTEEREFKEMIAREINGYVGRVLEPEGNHVAMGQVIAGISCGGFDRDTKLTVAGIYFSPSPSHLDNLFLPTISGDIGRTVVNAYLASRQTGNFSQIETANVEPAVSEVTNALVYGDMDGVILGTITPMIAKKQWKLSRIFRKYYLKDGIQVGGRVFRAGNRAERFGEILSDVELTLQTEVAAKIYYTIIRSWPKDLAGKCVKSMSKIFKKTSNKIATQGKGKGKSKKPKTGLFFIIPTLWNMLENFAEKARMVTLVPQMVDNFYKTYVRCPKVKTKYTLRYFVDLVRQLETETRLGFVDMTQAIVGVSEYFKSSYFGVMLDVDDHGHEYQDGFAWYVLREMITHGFSPYYKRRELGVIEAGGDVVAIGHVLAGIHAGTDRNTHIAQKLKYYKADTLYGATVAGNLAQAAVNRYETNKKTKNTMGGAGTWDRSSCPPKYKLWKSIKSSQHTTRAELLGDIDGFVLGEQLPVWLHGDPTLKLSTVLESYYGTGINDVSKDVRFDQFQTLSHGKDKVIEQTTLACKDIQRKAAKLYQKRSHDGSFCKEVAKEAVNKFYKWVLQTSGKLVL